LKSESGDFENVPEGWTPAVLCDVHDLGMVFSQFYGKSQHKIECGFWTGRYRSDDDRVPLMVYQRYTLSAHENALLRKHLEQWRGKRFRDEDECAGVELEDLIGKNLTIMVAHNQSGDKVFANVDAMGPGNGAPLGIPDGFIRKQDREQKDVAPQNYNRTRAPAAPRSEEYGYPESDHQDDDLPF
jgi:hypothetical protein